MDVKNNSKIQDIINIFNKNFEIVDSFKVRGVYDKLVEKDNDGEYNIENIVEDIFESDDDDKTKCEPSTKETSQKKSSSNPISNKDDDFGSSDQNEKPYSFKHSSQEYLKKLYTEAADDIFEIISSLDEKNISEVLTEVKNYFNNN